MKIQVKELDEELMLQVEGRLAGAFVPELETHPQILRTRLRFFHIRLAPFFV